MSGGCGDGTKTVFLTSLRPRLAVGLRGVGIGCWSVLEIYYHHFSMRIESAYRSQGACHVRKRVETFFMDWFTTNVELELRLIRFTEHISNCSSMLPHQNAYLAAASCWAREMSSTADGATLKPSVSRWVCLASVIVSSGKGAKAYLSYW